MRIEFSIGLGPEPEPDPKSQNPLSPLNLSRSLNRFSSFGYPDQQLMRIATDNGDDTYDCDRPNTEIYMKRVPTSRLVGSNFLTVGQTVVVKFYNRDRRKPYIGGLSSLRLDDSSIIDPEVEVLIDILCPGWFFHRSGDAFYIGKGRVCQPGAIAGGYWCDDGSGSGSGSGAVFLTGSGEAYGSGEPIPRKCKTFDFNIQSITEDSATEIGMLRSYSQYLLYVSGNNLVRKDLLANEIENLSVGGEITAVIYNPYAGAIETLSDGGADGDCDLDLSTCADQTQEGYEAGESAGESDGITDGLAAEGDEGAPFPGPSYDDTTGGEDCYIDGYQDGYSQAYESAFYAVIDGWNQASEDATSNGEADGEADCTNMDPYQTSYDDTAMGQCFGPPWTSPPYGAFQIGYCYRYQDAGDGAYAEAYDTGWENGGCTVP